MSKKKNNSSADINKLMKQFSQMNEQEELAAALGRKFGKLLQAKWPNNTIILAQAFASGIIAAEDDKGSREGCRSLLIRWMMEHIAGSTVEELMQDITSVHKHLLTLRYTASDPFEFNDLDNFAWCENKENPSVFVMQSQNRKNLVIINNGLLDLSLHVRRIWYKYDENRNAAYRKLKTLEWYRKNGWKPEYGDSRDAGYVASYNTRFNRKRVDNVYLSLGELDMFALDISSTLYALTEVQTDRISKIHTNDKK